MASVLLMLVLAFSFQGSQVGHDWLVARLSEHDGGYSCEECEEDLIQNINQARASANLPEVTVDPALRAWLKSEGSNISVEDTKVLLDKLQATDLCYTESFAVSAKAVSKHSLAHQFDESAKTSKASLRSIGVVVRSVDDGIGYEVMVVLGKKLKPFNPDELSKHDADEFAAVCPHCKARYGLRAQPTNGGLYLRCPKCDMNGGVLATDALGTYRWANEFLVGYQPPAVFPPDLPRQNEMLLIWSAVATDCVYRTDVNDPKDSRDTWQTPLETMVRGQGDCEDTSILLTDWLISRGFNARLAVGALKGEGHAWCVVRLDGVEYLLESTSAPTDPNHLPFVEAVGKDYIPVTLCDRDFIYVPAKGSQGLGSKYFSEDWVAIKPRDRNESLTNDIASKPRAQTTGAKPVALHKAESTQEEVPTFRFPGIGRLADVNAGSDSWQLTTPFAKSPRR